MLKAEDILNGLQSIVNNNSLFAVIWHGVFYLLIAALLLKWEPSNRLFGILLCIPLVSVAVFAWTTGNPFNGIMFSVASILILIFGIKADNLAVNYSQLTFIIAGIVMIIFGLVYPHFLNTDSAFKYLYASPAGLIPCPTLSILIGFTLMFNGFGSHSITLTFVVMGLFYSLFGIIKLAVYLDLFLLFGTITLIIKYILAVRISTT